MIETSFIVEMIPPVVTLVPPDVAAFQWSWCDTPATPNTGKERTSGVNSGYQHSRAIAPIVSVRTVYH
jgi:hypothetical protein